MTCMDIRVVSFYSTMDNNLPGSEELWKKYQDGSSEFSLRMLSFYRTSSLPTPSSCCPRITICWISRLLLDGDSEGDHIAGDHLHGHGGVSTIDITFPFKWDINEGNSTIRSAMNTLINLKIIITLLPVTVVFFQILLWFECTCAADFACSTCQREKV
jgi:hypothetical protein